jgi:hypothetical protein
MDAKVPIGRSDKKSRDAQPNSNELGTTMQSTDGAMAIETVIDEKAGIEKYDFLKMYLTKWNQLARFAPRSIILSHAGSGLVKYKLGSPLLNQERMWVEYGPALLAILKTLKLASRLSVILNEDILNEDDEAKARHLQAEIAAIENTGMRIFVRASNQKVMNLETGRFKKDRTNRLIFPEKPWERCPEGFIETRERTVARIVQYQGSFASNLDRIISEDLHELQIKKRDGTILDRSLICLFILEAPVAVEWITIERIGELAKRTGTVEAIITWHHDDVQHALYHPEKISRLGKALGMSEDLVEKEFGHCTTAGECLDRYLGLLKMWWTNAGVITGTKDPENVHSSHDMPGCAFVFCTSNKAGWAIAGFKPKKATPAATRRQFADILSFAPAP